MAELDQGDLPAAAVTKIATELDVPETEVIEMNRRLAGADNSLNALMGGVGADSDSEWLDMLPDESPSQETLIGDRKELQQRRLMRGVARANPPDRGAGLREAAARHARADPPHPPGQSRTGGGVRQLSAFNRQ